MGWNAVGAMGGKEVGMGADGTGSRESGVGVGGKEVGMGAGESRRGVGRGGWGWPRVMVGGDGCGGVETGSPESGVGMTAGGWWWGWVRECRDEESAVGGENESPGGRCDGRRVKVVTAPDVGCVALGAWERVWERGRRREAREQGGGVFTKGR